MFWVFINVNVTVIYVTTWCNNDWLTKNQTFCFYIIYRYRYRYRYRLLTKIEIKETN